MSFFAWGHKLASDRGQFDWEIEGAWNACMLYICVEL